MKEYNHGPFRISINDIEIPIRKKCIWNLKKILNALKIKNEFISEFPIMSQMLIEKAIDEINKYGYLKTNAKKLQDEAYINKCISMNYDECSMAIAGYQLPDKIEEFEKLYKKKDNISYLTEIIKMSKFP